jgi:hypothetical protein
VFDPLLSLFQWACESADPPVYSRHVTLEPTVGPPRHVLMMQGIVDHYILPPIADAESLSLGLDLAGPELDDTPPEIAGLAPLGPLLGLVGRSSVALPVSLDLRSKSGVEDGHEVVFQTAGPKHQYSCFLKGLIEGVPVVPVTGTAAHEPCP